MQILTEIAPLRGLRREWRQAHARVAFVPTMGNLHAGHMRLVEVAKGSAERVVVSVFVNPLQFDRPDDLAAYPRTLEADADRLRAAGVDALFAPAEALMYPHGRDCTRVVVPALADILEGAARPGHFDGVATVVSKLFHLVEPDLAVFGEKDFQQLLLVRRMVEDLNMPVEVRGVPTVREPDGLALSSRNGYLTGEERLRAPALYASLNEVAAALGQGARDLAAVEERAVAALTDQGLRPEYVTVRRSVDLAVPAAGDTDLVVLAAAWLGRARLIDNLRVRLPARP